MSDENCGKEVRVVRRRKKESREGNFASDGVTPSSKEVCCGYPTSGPCADFTRTSQTHVP